MAVAKANYGYASYSSVAQPVISQAEFSINAEIAYNEIQRRKNDSGQLLYQGTQDNLLDINEHELVFVRSAERHGPAPVVSQGPKCLSSFNLLKTGTINEFNLQRIETSPMKVAHEIAKQFRFLGVAKYTKQYNSAKYDHKHSALAVAAGGTRTIINTGSSAINGGDRLVWSLPEFDGEIFQKNNVQWNKTPAYRPIIMGVPTEKKLAVVEPYNIAIEKLALQTVSGQTSTPIQYNKGDICVKITPFIREIVNQLADSSTSSLFAPVIKEITQQVLAKAVATASLNSTATSFKTQLYQDDSKFDQLCKEAANDYLAYCNNTSDPTGLDLVLELGRYANQTIADRVIGYALTGHAKPNDTLDVALRFNRLA